MATLIDSVASTNLTTALGGSAPSAADDVLLQSSNRYTAGATFGSTALARMELTPTFGGLIADTTLTFTATSGKVRNRGRSRQVKWGANATASVWALYLNMPSADGLVQISNVTITSGFWVGGQGVIEDTTVLTAMWVHGGMLSIQRQASAGNAVGTLNVTAGTVELARDIGTLNIYGGSINIDDVHVGPTNVNVYNGSIAWGRAATAQGTLVAYAGLLDFSNLAQDITFTAVTLGPAVKIRLPTTGATITWGSVTLPGDVDPRQAI